jgi:hypothetical protein
LFVVQLFEFEVKEDFPLGIVFGEVTGTDSDIGSNAILFYHLISNGERVIENQTLETLVDL